MTGGWLRDPRYDAGLDRLVELQARESALFAERARTLAHLAARTSREGWQAEAPFESLVLDVAGSCVLGQVSASSRLLDAEHLVVRLPETLAVLESGRLGVHQTQVLVAETRDLAPEVCAEVERRVLPEAPPLCPADLRRLVRRVVLEVDAAEQERREAEAQARRRVWVKPVEDGMALLCALLPAEQAQAAYRQLTDAARAAGAVPGEERCADQLRADLLAERLTGRADGAHPAVRVVVHVPLASALGLSDAPGELEGHGAISASRARRLLEGAELQRACVDPERGDVWALDAPVHAGRRGLHAPPAAPAAPPAAAGGSAVPLDDPPAGPRRPAPGRLPQTSSPTVRAALLGLRDAPPPVPLPPEPRHDPSRPLARLVRLRDGRCDGIGCSVPASRCELDHVVPWPDGDTSAANLRARSQRCHHAKHDGWATEQRSDGTVWTSPGGRRYLVPRRGPAPPPRTGS